MRQAGVLDQSSPYRERTGVQSGRGDPGFRELRSDCAAVGRLHVAVPRIVRRGICSASLVPIATPACRNVCVSPLYQAGHHAGQLTRGGDSDLKRLWGVAPWAGAECNPRLVQVRFTLAPRSDRKGHSFMNHRVSRLLFSLVATACMTTASLGTTLTSAHGIAAERANSAIDPNTVFTLQSSSQSSALAPRNDANGNGRDGQRCAGHPGSERWSLPWQDRANVALHPAAGTRPGPIHQHPQRTGRRLVRCDQCVRGHERQEQQVSERVLQRHDRRHAARPV